MARRTGRWGDRHGRLRRGPSTGIERPVITVLFDDTETAFRYFRSLANGLRGRIHFDLHPAPRHGATPAQLAREAESLLTTRDDGSAQRVWCVVDLEGSREQEARVDAAFAALPDRGITPVRSQPCFELWTLLHFADTGRAYANCAEVLNELKKRWPDGFEQAGGKKAQLPYEKIVDRRDTAAERARRHHASNAPSWTELYLLIEEIDQLDAAARLPTNG